MPGEQRGCIGCHEQRKGIHSPPNTGSYSLATAKLPVRPELPRWGTRGIIEYESVVQPVFDKHCVSCHSGPRPDGLLNLSADRTTVFNLSYLELTEKEFVHFTHGNGRTFAQLNLDYDEQAPLSRGSVLSKLTRVLDDPEHRDGDSRLTWEEKLRVFLWIDSNIPFYGHYEQHSPTILSGFAIKTLKAIYHKRCAACHNQPGQPDTPDFLHPWSIQVHVGKNSPGQWNLAKSGMRVRHLNLSNPADSAAVLAPLSKESGGWGLCKLPAGKAVFPSADDPDRKKLLETLTSGVVRRDQPGVVELIENQHGKPHYQLITR
jgi:hypothetical protein